MHTNLKQNFNNKLLLQKKTWKVKTVFSWSYRIIVKKDKAEAHVFVFHLLIISYCQN